MKSFAAVTLICLISLSASAQGLKCYVCGGNSCADPYSSTGEHETTCTPDMATKSVATLKSAANKITSALETLGINAGSVDLPNVKLVCVKLEVKSGENEMVTRSCAATTDKTDICESLRSENSECSTCDSDLCNGATAAHLSLALMSVTALLLASYSH